ncbi:MAG: tRNA(Ile)-lysidine synthase [Solirubrobacteraceae bacterium]|jgi:tRNA(Ile)-lysidine synthase|nr:tRNA(Ile)-lysidine synthase [Solirubrobacteraceae bacterium]
MNEQEVLDRVRSGELLVFGRAVLVLLSGGRDSVCLLDLAVRISGADSVQALHVNYGLRAEAADEDERHCVRLCGELGVPLEVERPRSPRGNIQAWARDVRYRAAAAIAQRTGAEVATGHTATDQVEGVLYRLASSPSRRALLGMRARNGNIVRPLLELTRADTGSYCRERGLTWRDDATNAELGYARGRARGELVPALRALHPAAEANVLALMEILRDEAAVLDTVLDEVLEGRPEIELARLRELPAGLRRLVVQRLADVAAGGPAAGIAGRADEVAALRDQGTASLDLGSGVRAVAEYGVLRLEPAPGPVRPAPGPVPPPREARLAVPGAVGFGDYEVRCEIGPPERRPGSLDRAALGPELVVRTWRPGDRMAPLGLAGTKSLQDLFTARRVARARRATVPVVEFGGDIVWVAGVATSERFKVTADTREAVHLSAVINSKAVDDDAIGDILVNPEELQNRVRELAAEISRDYAGRDLVLIGVLKGAVFFLSDLMRQLDVPCEVDFMAVASYGSATKSSGVVRILKDLDAVIEGRDVLIVEDIVDSGLTLQYLLRNLGARNPRSLEVCALLTKPDRRKVDLPTRYVGFEIPDRFVIGYGLDHGERYRNLSFVAALKE